jgi:hypothetical protein
MNEKPGSSKTSVHVYHYSRRHGHDNFRSHSYRLSREGLRKMTQNTSNTVDAAPQTPDGRPRNAIRNCYRLGQQTGNVAHCTLVRAPDGIVGSRDFAEISVPGSAERLLSSVSVVKTSLPLMSEHGRRLSDTQVEYIDKQLQSTTLHKEARRRVSAFHIRT